MHKTFFINIGKILFISLLILPFLFQGGTQTLGQTDTDCAYGGTLGSWSDSSFTVSQQRMLGEVGLNFNSPIKENKTHSSVTITALDPLPAGLQLSKSDIVYSTPIQGTNAWTRYSITGTPTQAGTFKVRLKAESASCGNDTGYVNIEISSASVSCTLTANSPITPGQSTVLSWTTNGGVSSGSISPAVMGAGNFTTSGNIQTLPLTQDTTFTLNIFSSTGQSGSCNTSVIVGSTSGSKLKFIKTVLDIPLSEYGIGSVTADALFSGNNFVIAGARCTTRSGGEGLWFVSEDGSTTTGRQACVDADSGINMSPYQHGSASSFAIFPEWQSGGFIRENAVQGGNCLKWGVDVYDCIVTGPGAQKSVFYSSTGVPVSKSPLYTYNTGPVGLSGRVIAPSSAGGGGYHILSLPSWTLLGATSQGFDLGYGNFGIANGTLYSISDFGVIKEEKKLVASADAGDQKLFYSFDNSVKPARLVIWEQSKKDSTTGPKVYIYDGNRLHKIINLPTTLSSKSFSGTGRFGVWGSYIIIPGIKTGEIDVYKDGVKVESVRMQTGSNESIFKIVSSPKGYVLVVTGKTSYLYKIADSPGSPVVPPTTGGMGMLKFVKTLLKVNNSYQYPQHIQDGIVANDKFILGGKGCLQSMKGGMGGGLWIISENGSSVSERDVCVDGGLSRNIGSSFHGITSTGDLYVNWGGDGFIKGNYNPVPEANHAVYYNKAGVPRTSSPLDLYNKSLIVLKDRLLAENSRSDRTSLDLVSLPDWKLTATVALPSEYSYSKIFASVGFGDFLFSLIDGYLVSVDKDGTLKKIKQLVSEEFILSSNNVFAYSFDNSTTPAKLAIFVKSRDSVTKKILVYKLSLGGVTLDKTINLPADFPNISTKNNFGIWGDYIVVKNNSYTEHFLELWKGGQKIHSIKIEDPTRLGDNINSTGVDTILISKNGYVAASFGYVNYNNGSGQLQDGTVSYLFKIEASVSTVPTTPGSPVGTNCGNATGVLAELCKQYNEILRRTCLVAPNIAICKN